MNSLFQSTEILSNALSYKTIERVGIDFFAALGHTSFLQEPIFASSDVLHFMYVNMKIRKVLTSEDRNTLDEITNIAYLFKKDNESFRYSNDQYIEYFSVEIDNSCIDRSLTAHDIHQVIAKVAEFYSVILFRYREKYMLSFNYCVGKNTNSIILSDWFDEYHDNFFRSLTAYNFSDIRISEYFFDFIYAAARSYYIHPMSKEYIRFESLPPLLIKDGEKQYYHQDELNDLVEDMYNEQFLVYGDDFFEVNLVNSAEAEDSIDDIDFDLIEYELDNMEIADKEWEESSEEGDFGDELQFDAISISSEILEDPLKLLDWLNDNEKDAGQEDGMSRIDSQSEIIIDDDNLLEVIQAEGLEYIDNRSKGGILWVVGGKEITAFIKKISSETRKFTFKRHGGKSTKRKDSWWMR